MAGGLFAASSRQMMRGLGIGLVLGFASGPAYWFAYVYKKYPSFLQTFILLPAPHAEAGAGAEGAAAAAVMDGESKDHEGAIAGSEPSNSGGKTLQ
jgi:hypothetical protein